METSQLVGPLNDLIVHVLHISSLYPENAQLVRILDVARGRRLAQRTHAIAAVSRLPVSAPLEKTLVGVETLMVRCLLAGHTNAQGASR
jgi:hypothetical protein